MAHVIMTERRDGDLAVDAVGVEARRQGVVNAPWTWLRQVHGDRVVEVTAPGSGAGQEGDALWTRLPGSVLSVQVADCAPVALIAASGHVGVVHAGWRGLMAGAIEACAAQMRAGGAGGVVAVVGACIHPERYEFGEADLNTVEDQVGPRARGRTATGEAALDLPASVEAVLAKVDIPIARWVGGCTADEADRRWSHRARGDVERQALVVWMEGP